MITEVGDDPKVAALVYVSAYAPDVGQSANDASAPFGWNEGQKQIRVGSDKFATVIGRHVGRYRAETANGRPKLAFAVQGQSHAPMFDKKLTTAAWKNAARRMGAVITTLPTCHMVILEEPAKVAAVIDEAARTASKQQDELLTSQ